MTDDTLDPQVMRADRWRSEQFTARARTSLLTRGQLIIAGQRPFRVQHVVELAVHDWPQDYIEAWRAAGRLEVHRWSDRPHRIDGFWNDQGPEVGERLHQIIAPGSYAWSVLPDHYSVCRVCGELPPCTHVHHEAILSRAREQLEKEMALLPGTCHSCGEPVTRRQRSITFPGANLIRPDFGDHSAIFHTRGKCASGMRTYDQRWAKAAPDRTRLLYCDGALVMHADHTSECSAASACPAQNEHGDLVDHRVTSWHHAEDGRYKRPGTGTCWCLTNRR